MEDRLIEFRDDSVPVPGPPPPYPVCRMTPGTTITLPRGMEIGQAIPIPREE
jgi:hypothetical protein